MDKENMVYVHNDILFSYKEGNLAIFSKMGGTRECYAK
jgi:hypothetical protein